MLRSITPDCSAIFPTENEINEPKITPKIPPTKPIKPASTINIYLISIGEAPIAFIIPISFFLSRTFVNIEFIIPIAPTNKDIAAIPTKTT